MPVGPEWIVNPPATVLPAHSLLSSATIVEEPEGSRWESGFVFKPENCIEAEVWQPCGPDGQIVVQLQIDATGGSYDISYDGGPAVTLPWDANAGDVDAAVASTSGGLSSGAVTVISDAASANPPSQLFFVIRQGTSYQPNELAFTDNDDDPLTGGTGLIVNLLSLWPGQEWSSNLTPAEYGIETKKDYDGQQGNISYAPFIVEVPYTCSTWGFQENDYQGRALRQLEAGLSKAIEREFWTGEKNPSNMNLTYWTPNDDNHVVNPGGAAAPVAVDVATGLILLEQALANCAAGASGLIHMTTAVAAKLAGLYIVDDDDTNQNKFLSTRARDDIIIVGAGYTGDGPFGQPAIDPDGTEAWAFATGQVDIRLGEPMIYPDEFWMALDRATNTVTFRGEQVASAVWDGCCSFAVLIDYALPT